MGKADMLKQGAKKTATGLFAGMTPLEAREIVAPEKKAEVNVTTEKNVVEQPKPIEPAVIEKPPVERVIEEKVEEPALKATFVEPAQKPKENKAIDIVKAVEKHVEAKEEAVEDAKDEKAVSSDSKSTSRYEKEKFLLLDIRGYREYVEHMAKAANMSATKYIRSLIQADMDKNMDIYEAHKALEKMLKDRAGN